MNFSHVKSILVYIPIAFIPLLYFFVQNDYSYFIYNSKNLSYLSI